MNDVLYRGTVWDRLEIIYSLGCKEPMLTIKGKTTSNPADAISHATRHFIASGSDATNLPCVIAIDGRFSLDPLSSKLVHYTPTLVPLSGTRILNPADDDTIDTLLAMVRKSPHPSFRESLEAQQSTLYSEAVNMYITTELIPRIQELKQLVTLLPPKLCA